MELGSESFESWYRREHPLVLSAMTVVSRNVDVAAEATDEAFARACERWSRVARMDKPGGWVHRTAMNSLKRRLRRRRLEMRILRRDMFESEVPPPDWSAELWDALGRLPARERAAVALRYVAGLTNVEVADAMGIAAGTVGATLHSARRKLASALGEPEEINDLEVVDE